jgi:hypothetical protein
MQTTNKRFWFEFELEDVFNSPPAIGLGCGITACDYDDALRIMEDKIFSKTKMQPIKMVIENVDINTLD